MSQPILVKVYGNLSPYEPELAEKLKTVLKGCYPPEEALRIDGDLLLISFEGIYFPLDEVITLISADLYPSMTGKVDYLDIENWRLVRYVINKGIITRSEAPLNNVMDYSGH